MEKANETWNNDLCPIEAGENTDDSQVSFIILLSFSYESSQSRVTQLLSYYLHKKHCLISLGKMCVKYVIYVDSTSK